MLFGELFYFVKQYRTTRTIVHNYKTEQTITLSGKFLVFFSDLQYNEK